MIDTILFDFGNVIAYFDPEYIVKDFVVDEKDVDLLKSAVYDDWQALDKGVIDYEDYIQKTKSMLPDYLHPNVNSLFNTWYKHMPYIENMPQLIKKLKRRGYRLLILSNAPIFFGDVLDYFDITKFFEDKVISGSIRMIKPDIRIYQYTIEKFNLIPENTVFIDDNIDNVNGAKACNLNSILFEDNTEKLIKTLRKEYNINI